MKIFIPILILTLIAYFIGKHDGKIIQERAIYAQFERNFTPDPGQGIIYSGSARSASTYGSLQEKLKEIRAKKTFIETLYDILVSTFFDKEETAHKEAKTEVKRNTQYLFHEDQGPPGYDFGPLPEE